MTLEIIGVIIMVLATIFVASTFYIMKKRENKFSFKESMDLTELPVITFQVNNRKINFLLDTGSNVSYINNSVLPFIDHEKTNDKMSFIGIEGNKSETEFCKIIISYKKQSYIEEFSIADLDNAFNIIKQESGVQIHGILGSRFFEKYKYILDFKTLTAYTK